MECPRDRTPLVAAARPGGEVHGCPACGGVFVAKPDLDAVLAAHEPAAAPAAVAERPAYLACPRCRKPTRRGNFGRVSGVMVDDCPYCGTWFDAGELDRVVVFLRAGGAARGAAMEAQLADEKRATAAKLERLEAKVRAAERARSRRYDGF